MFTLTANNVALIDMVDAKRFDNSDGGDRAVREYNSDRRNTLVPYARIQGEGTYGVTHIEKSILFKFEMDGDYHKAGDMFVFQFTVDSGNAFEGTLEIGKNDEPTVIVKVKRFNSRGVVIGGKFLKHQDGIKGLFGRIMIEGGAVLIPYLLHEVSLKRRKKINKNKEMTTNGDNQEW